MDEIKNKIKEINAKLLEGEPKNISVDTYSGYSGYKPQHVIDTMNSVMFGEWGFEEIETHTISGKGKDNQDTQLAITKVKVWIKGVEFQPTAWGQSRVTKGDVGDAKKGAQTDAIKKGLAYFSIGNRSYHGLLETKLPTNNK
jgi:hypothetical protein